jgi:hypothetical protein
MVVVITGHDAAPRSPHSGARPAAARRPGTTRSRIVAPRNPGPAAANVAIENSIVRLSAADPVNRP